MNALLLQIALALAMSQGIATHPTIDSFVADCPYAGPDTVICNFQYVLEGSEQSGSWEALCDSSQGFVFLETPWTDTTRVKVDRCGEYQFVYSVDIPGCDLSDTVRVTFGDPSSRLRSEQLDIDVFWNTECHQAPALVICENTVEIQGLEQPLLSAEYCGMADCRSIIYSTATGSNLTECYVDNIMCDSLTVTDQGSSCAVDVSVGADDVWEFIGEALDINLSCPDLPDCSIPPLPPTCYELVIDSIDFEVPRLNGGSWHLVDDSGSVVSLSDTSFFSIDGRDYVLIISPGVEYYGPDDIEVTIWEVINGLWNELVVPVEISIRWIPDVVYDTVSRFDTLQKLLPGCIDCRKDQVIPPVVDFPPVPPFPCDEIDLNFAPAPNDVTYFEFINCEFPVVDVEVCPGQIQFFDSPGLYIVQCIDASVCPYEVFIDIIAEFDQPTVDFLSVDCNPFGDSYSVTLEVFGGNGSIQIDGYGVFDYNESITISDVPSCQALDLVITDLQSGCIEEVSAYECCCEVSTHDFQVELCPGEQIEFDGQMLDSAGIYSATFPSATGCDSLVILELIVLTQPYRFKQVTICDGISYDFYGLTIDSPGTYYHISNNNTGCDSLIEWEVSMGHASVEASPVSSCWNMSTGKIVLSETSTGDGGEFLLDGNPLGYVNLVDGLEPGVYDVTYVSADGCFADTVVQIEEVAPLAIDLPNEFIACGDVKIRLDLDDLTSGQFDYLEWNDGSNVMNRTLDKPGNYWVEIGNQCETVRSQFQIRREDVDLADKIYVPNVFSPNGDGVNDEFRVFTSTDLDDFELHLYDRWGDELCLFNSPDETWDGTFRGQLMNSAVVVWWLRARGTNCDGRVEEVLLKGDLTIVR